MGPGGLSETKDVETAVVGLGVTSVLSIGLGPILCVCVGSRIWLIIIIPP